MKRVVPFILFICLYWLPGKGQELKYEATELLFHGLVMDSGTEIPLSNTQIFINRNFFSISDNEGKFAFYVSKNDTVLFRRLGFKSTSLLVSDTLAGKEFIAGIYLNADTITIGEVIIVPRLSSLKSEMLAPRDPADAETENARYNLAISAYQGKVNQGKTGDPASNYEVLRRMQKSRAYSKGQLSPDQIAGISPLLLIPAAYLLINGLPEKPPPLQPRLTEREVSELHKKYLETSLQRKK